MEKSKKYSGTNNSAAKKVFTSRVISGNPKINSGNPRIKSGNPRIKSGDKLNSRNPKINSGNLRVNYEDNTIFWCQKCNLPLIGEKCGLCGNSGERIILSQPADVRFCSPYEREVLKKQLISVFGCDPLGDRIILLNKIPGEDKTDEVIVDGFNFGILRFELSKMDYIFEPSAEGAKVLLQHGAGKKVGLKKGKYRHLNGKNLEAEAVQAFSEDIRAGDFVLVQAGNSAGYGISYIDGRDFSSLKINQIEAGRKVLRIRKIGNGRVTLHPKVPELALCIEANRKHLQVLGKNAINTIRGIANRSEYRKLPVSVSFSGGKDSLAALDLTRAALKQRDFKAFFLNTGIEFPETVEFARNFCRNEKIQFEEINAGSAFWDNVEKFGPPAKDFRWCCKVCKLASASELETNEQESEQRKEIQSEQKREKQNEKKNTKKIAYLTIDGKRRHESFLRARIAASETNPFVPNQLNIFPIRDWRAFEVWLYIYWRKLTCNPLYEEGFERVGCWLCPSALAAEYEQVKVLHPELAARWEAFLYSWASSRGLSEEFVERGFWRWKALPPKMLKLAEKLEISVQPEEKNGTFEIEVVSGISPCRAGGFSVEAGVKGIKLKEAAAFLNVLGPTVFGEEMGVLLIRATLGTVKFFSNGSLLVSSDTKEKALSLFKETAKQLVRLSRCTHCGICVKACPTGAISISEKGLCVSEACIRCGKCTEACVVTRYFNKLAPDFDKGFFEEKV